ncbi:YitT family protein [Nocardioides pocheonensis]|uniref:YitT family protein n=1 Tax=Nocardioides pocheonensis TaxID=661485 RepID=A0A3N0GKS8_9ACTN|nr:YitT family protein [Nocardioides pocheonensis]RNM12660.1 YitT family protein [Nocardioides pocheonensis]
MSTPRVAPPHTPLEDAFGLFTGVFVASLGIYLIQAAGAVTGGTAGLSLLLSYATSVPFGVLFVLINVPAFAVAAWQKGASFTLKSLGCVVAVSLATRVQADMLDLDGLHAAYGVVAGNLLAGSGLLILFRHGASLGGFNVVALLMQEKVGLRAGYVQMALDVAVVLGSVFVVDPGLVLLSALGAVVLNLVLALNHRPGRYLGL